MKHSKEVTLFTPLEARFIRDTCKYDRGRDSDVETLYTKVEAGTLDWALSVLPKDLIAAGQNTPLALQLFTVLAERRWQPDQGEVISTHFEVRELRLLRALGIVSIEEAQNSSVNMERTHGATAMQGHLNQNDADIMRDADFEFFLEHIAVGTAMLHDIDQSLE